jgi:hypothetical protein
VLSSEVLLTWRASAFVSAMLSLSSGSLPVCLTGWCEGTLEAVEMDMVCSGSSSLGGDAVLREGRAVGAGAGAGAGAERVLARSSMAFRRWRSSSCCESACAAGEDVKCAAVMAASCEKA